MNKILSILLACTAAGAAYGAQETGQVTGQAAKNVAIDSVVVTGARYASDIRHLPMSVAVVDRDEIVRRQEASVLPLLTEQVPGLFVTGRGVMGYGVSDGADRLSPVKQAEKMAVVWKILAVIVGERLPDSGRRIAARNIDFIRRVSSIVEENYQTGLTSRDAAARMNYTLTYFCRVFRKCFGKSFSAYLIEYRVFMATCMRGQCATIAEIAEKVGFDDYCYFSNVFRRQVGVSPREYFRGNG